MSTTTCTKYNIQNNISHTQYYIYKIIEFILYIIMIHIHVILHCVIKSLSEKFNQFNLSYIIHYKFSIKMDYKIICTPRINIIKSYFILRLSRVVLFSQY